MVVVIGLEEGRTQTLLGDIVWPALS